LQQLGWITGKWGTSDTGRRARFYSITRTGRKQLDAEEANWSLASRILARFIEDLP